MTRRGIGLGAGRPLLRRAATQLRGWLLIRFWCTGRGVIWRVTELHGSRARTAARGVTVGFAALPVLVYLEDGVQYVTQNGLLHCTLWRCSQWCCRTGCGDADVDEAGGGWRLSHRLVCGFLDGKYMLLYKRDRSPGICTTGRAQFLSPVVRRAQLRGGSPVTVALYRLGLGNFSHVKGVGGAVYEYRVDFGPGYRIYIGKDGEQIVILLCGGSKKQQQEDIELAGACWRDYKQQKRSEQWR